MRLTIYRRWAPHLRWARARRLVLALAVLPSGLLEADEALVRFDRLVLSEEFFSEGADFADLDGDGDQDVVSGPYWYEGPEFRRRHAYSRAKPEPLSIKAYSKHFFSFVEDFNSDGQPDILAVPMPGEPAHWFENPGPAADLPWRKHLALDEVSNESPTLVDLTGDGRRELVCIRGGAYGYAEPDPGRPTAPWRWTAITPSKGYGRFTHGLGVGDLNGDGRQDLLETEGWWEQTAAPGELFRFHPQRFAESGAAQIFAYDFDGDGDQDVLATQNAHAYGLAWFEQTKPGEFAKHSILTQHPADNPYALAISQMHAVALADIDRDGVKDFVTGKRYYAHGGGDPGAQELAVLYWFKTHRDKDGVWFEPWPIDRRSGLGTQLSVGDLTGDGWPDVIVGNKLGTKLFLNRPTTVDAKAYAAARPPRRSRPRDLAGTAAFAEAVRTSEPLSPAEQATTFILPAGFDIELVTSEPTIHKPMNLAFDARGRLWASSSEEYPYAAPLDRKGRDKILVFTDRDGDGLPESATTFADGLNIPIGLLPYGRGVIAWSIPHVWYLEDLDQDDRADRRTRLYGPAGYERDTHGMLNSFTRGLDGWIYACHGFNNQTKLAGSDGHEIRMNSGNIWRLRVDGTRVENHSFGQVNPFGLAFDDFGDLFSADCHTKPISLLIPGGIHEQFGAPDHGLGFVPPVMQHLHGSTAIAGIVLGSTLAFPEVYRARSFGGNVMTSRVNQNRLERRGGSVRAVEEADFLLSNDPWFRPVDLEAGPDGALYIADFYNRIIGHYEVPLDHPGRDRLRGRIWRVVYRADNSERRDPCPQLAPAKTDLTQLSRKELIEELPTSLATRGQLVVDRLIDHHGRDDAEATKKATLALVKDATVSPLGRARGLWVLARLGGLDDFDNEAEPEDGGLLYGALHHPARLLRAQAQQIAAEFGNATHARIGLQDTDPLVRRFAAQTARRHRSSRLIEPLLEALGQAGDDPHLHHALKIALRFQLEDESTYRLAVRNPALTPDDAWELAEVSLALGTPSAGEFLADYLLETPELDAARRKRYLRFAVRHVSEKQVTPLVEMARTHFAPRREDSLAVLGAIREGLALAGTEPPAAVLDWALELARRDLGLDDSGGEARPRPSLTWNFLPVAGPASEDTAWVVSRRRRSADGRESKSLWSSFPRGEARTGIFRSEPFELPETFTLWIAGHDGFPDKPPQGRNLVRLRDAETLETLRSFAPPRNDTAQRFEWKPGAAAGRSVVCELVDRDTADAYAWLAVGRFSVEALNPSRLPELWQSGAGLAAEFQLRELRDELLGRLRLGHGGVPTQAALARAVAVLDRDARSHALARALAIPTVGATLRRELIDSLGLPPDDRPEIPLRAVLKLATRAEQLGLAEALAGDRSGGGALLELVDEGTASARLLLAPTVAPKLAAALSPGDREALAELTRDLPEEDPALEALLEARKAEFLAEGGAQGPGRELFQSKCSACHRIGDVGAQFAPQLDGIGNRGLDRLLEDILAPNRNVDLAFRATTVVTKGGQVHTGLLRPSGGESLTLIDREGQPIEIAQSKVAIEETTRASPMPANFAEVLKPRELRDLLAYLLSLR